MEGARILVVEDDFFIRFDVENILKSAGAKIAASCASVDQALEALDRDGLIDAAILDVRMESETVAPVAERLAVLRIPFLFYTGQVEQDELLRRWPDRTILSKPALPDAIVASMVALMRE